MSVLCYALYNMGFMCIAMRLGSIVDVLRLLF